MIIPSESRSVAVSVSSPLSELCVDVLIEDIFGKGEEDGDEDSGAPISDAANNSSCGSACDDANASSADAEGEESLISQSSRTTTADDVVSPCSGCDTRSGRSAGSRTTGASSSSVSLILQSSQSAAEDDVVSPCSATHAHGAMLYRGQPAPLHFPFNAHHGQDRLTVGEVAFARLFL